MSCAASSDPHRKLLQGWHGCTGGDAERAEDGRADAPLLVRNAPPAEPDTKVEMADGEMTGAVKPQGLFDNKDEEEQPDWGGDEPTGVGEVEQEDTPTVAPADVVTEALQDFLAQMQGLMQARMQATQQTLSAMNTAKAGADATQPQKGKQTSRRMQSAKSKGNGGCRGRNAGKARTGTKKAHGPPWNAHTRTSGRRGDGRATSRTWSTRATWFCAAMSRQRISPGSHPKMGQGTPSTSSASHGCRQQRGRAGTR